MKSPSAILSLPSELDEARRRREEDDQDLSVDNHGDDWSSLLSEGRTDDWRSDDDCCASSSAEEDEFQARWDELERRLAARWAYLEKITVGKKSACVRQMRRREMEVARLERDELLLEQIAAQKDNSSAEDTGKDEKKDRAGRKTDGTDDEGTAPKKRTRIQSVCDFLTFELNSTVPAILSLLLHNIAMAGIFELGNDCLNMVYAGTAATFSSSSSSSPQLSEAPDGDDELDELQDEFKPANMVEFCFFGAAFLLGCALMRSTGDLFWWLSDRDYDCLKFDYHNRIRLRYPGARIVHAVRSSLLVRCFVYMVGYNACYQMSQEIFEELSERLWNQNSNLLRHLPSSTFDVNLFQTEEAAWEEPDISSIFPCERTCQEEIDRREAAFEEMVSADMEYTERVLATSSYSTFWQKWITCSDYMGIDDAPPVYNPLGDLLFYVAVLSCCIAMLRWYGFVFWERY